MKKTNKNTVNKQTFIIENSLFQSLWELNYTWENRWNFFKDYIAFNKSIMTKIRNGAPESVKDGIFYIGECNGNDWIIEYIQVDGKWILEDAYWIPGGGAA